MKVFFKHVTISIVSLGAISMAYNAYQQKFVKPTLNSSTITILTDPKLDEVDIERHYLNNVEISNLLENAFQLVVSNLAFKNLTICDKKMVDIKRISKSFDGVSVQIAKGTKWGVFPTEMFSVVFPIEIEHRAGSDVFLVKFKAKSSEIVELVIVGDDFKSQTILSEK
jgi:hypothetical protein